MVPGAAVPERPSWLVAHSYAGMLARALIERYPKLVKGVVLIEANWPENTGQCVLDLLTQDASNRLLESVKRDGDG